MIVPLVAGAMDATVLDKMIGLVLGAFGHTAAGQPGRPTTTAATRTGKRTATRSGASARTPLPLSRLPLPRPPPPSPAAGSGRCEISPQAWQALRYALAKLAVDLVSGPAGVASILRRGLLEHPWNTPSLPLDIGYSESIPAAIRRAVLWRDRYKCAWPRCGRPAAWCDVHHIEHKRTVARQASIRA